LDEIQAEVLKVFLLVIHSHLYSFALRFLFYFFKITQPLTVSVKEKGGKPDRKTMPPSLWFKKSIQNLKSENSKRLCPETSALFYVHEFGFFINVLTISWKAQGVVGHLQCLASLLGYRETKR
jgi:hypothetical protein